MTAFWGCVIQPGAKPTPYVPPPDGSRLHISQATLAAGAHNGDRVAVKIHTGEEDKTSVLLCALRAGVTDTTHLDIILHEYAEFTLEGDTPVHLCGNYMPDMDLGNRLMDLDDEGEEEEEEEDEGDDGYMPHWMMAPYGAVDEEDDDDYDEDEEDDEDDEFDVDEDEDEEEEDVPRRTTKKGGVVIQELGDEDEDAKHEEKDKVQPPPSAGKGARPHDADFIPLGTAGAAAASATKKRPVQDNQPQQAAPPQKKPATGTPPATQKGGRPEGNQQGSQASVAKPGSQFNDGPPGSLGSRKFNNGLEVINLVNGKPDGKVALPGKKLSMKYIGRLKSNGKVFDATKGAPFTFRLGIGEVIKGWDIGIKNMRVGDKRRLIIPPELGYGARGAPGAIPPNAWLEFDVELVNVHN